MYSPLFPAYRSGVPNSLHQRERGRDNQPANIAYKTPLFQKVLGEPPLQSQPRLDLVLFLNGAVAEKAKLYGESKIVQSYEAGQFGCVVEPINYSVS